MKVRARYDALPDAESRARGEQIVEWLRYYGERRINSRLMDERRSIPPYVGMDFGRQGLFGIQVERAHGGLALRSREVARILEQAAAVDLALGTFLLVCLFPGVRPIAGFGSDELKRAVLPDLAAGRMLAGYAQTEPGAGTHFPAMATQALRGVGGWRLSGDKVWIGNATWAGILTVMAHEVDGSGRRHGMTAFAVPVDRPGVRLGRELPSMGMRAVVQAEVGFRDVLVSEADVLGEIGQGLDVGVDSMSWSRFAIAATCIGSMKRCVQIAHRFASRRGIATGPLLAHPVTLAYLGESFAQLSCADALLAEVARRIDAGEGVAAELFAASKLVASEFLCEVADRTMQLLGSRGYDEANLVPQIVRDARVTRIFEGASEPLAAFLGAWALPPSSDLYVLLRSDLAAPAVADALLGAVEAARGRGWQGSEGTSGGAIPRTWLQALAGSAAAFAILAALADRDHRAGARSGAERTAAWARTRFQEACARLREGTAIERARFEPPELEKALEAIEASIGDVEQQLPGERNELDPLLRRDPPTG